MGSLSDQEKFMSFSVPGDQGFRAICCIVQKNTTYKSFFFEGDTVKKLDLAKTTVLKLPQNILCKPNNILWLELLV